MEKKPNGHSISSAETLGYGLGSFATQLANRTVSQYLLLFLTNCLLLDPVAAGSIFLVGRLIDAVTDLIMANLADRTKSRFGSYRPWLLYASVPLVLSFIGCFSVPGFLRSDRAKFLWVAVMYLLETSIFLTATGTSYGTLATVIARDPMARAKLAGARSVGETAGVLLINALMMPLILRFGGLNNAKGWTVAAVTFSVLILAGYLFCFRTVKERYAVVPKEAEAQPLRVRARCLKGNTPLLSLFGATFVLLLGMTYAGNAFSYYCIYNLGHAEWVASLSVTGSVFGLAGAALLPKLAARIEKRYILVLGAGCFALGAVSLVGISGYTGALLYSILAGIGNALGMAAIWSLIPEAADFGQRLNGVAAPGLIFSVITFVIKAVGGLSSYFVGFVLSAIGFDAALPVQTPAALQGLSVSIVGVLFGASVLCLLFSFGCRKLDRKRMQA